MYIEWKKLQQLKKLTNETAIIRERWPGWQDDDGEVVDSKPIYAQDAKSIYWCFRMVINHIKETFPDDWKRGFPPEIIQWYEEDQQVFLPKNGNWFVMVPYWFIDDYWSELKPQEIKVLLTFARHASFVQEVNKWGCHYGETNVSNKTIARECKMSDNNIDRITGSLKKKGHLITISKELDGRRNKCIRWVAFMLEGRKDDKKE